MKPIYKCACSNHKSDVMDMPGKKLSHEHSAQIYHRKGPGKYHDASAKITSRKRGM